MTGLGREQRESWEKEGKREKREKESDCGKIFEKRSTVKMVQNDEPVVVCGKLHTTKMAIVTKCPSNVSSGEKNHLSRESEK